MDEAIKMIEAIKNEYDLSVLIETQATVPDDKIEAVKEMDSSELGKFFATWTAERFAGKDGNAIYILVCKSPKYFYIRIGTQARTKAFTQANHNKLRTLVRAEFKKGQYTAALHKCVEFIQSTVRANLAK
jgi:uncharacterized membrane protein YgcG